MNRGLAAAAFAAALGVAGAASAQESGGFLDRVFGTSPVERTQLGPPAGGQEPATDQVLRIERLEAQIRQLTGTVEQLQYRNRQLEAQIRSMGGTPGGQPAATGQPSQPTPPQAQALPAQPQLVQPPPAQVARVPGQVYMPGPPPVPPGAVPGRRDVFDPSQNPNAPGVPQTLGSIPAQPPNIIAADPPVGAPGGRTAGQPLDLSTLATNMPPGTAVDAGQPMPPGGDGLLPPPPSRNPNATGAVAAVAPPSDSPKDTYDLAYGYVLRKDYALAEDAFQAFLKKYPTDRRAADAQFWLGESLYQRQRYDTAASAFLDLSTKHSSHAKAPDALLRLAQSLAAMKQKEMACATLAEVGRKYPRASNSVKQGVEREQKRVAC